MVLGCVTVLVATVLLLPAILASVARIGRARRRRTGNDEGPMTTPESQRMRLHRQSRWYQEAP